MKSKALQTLAIIGAGMAGLASGVNVQPSNVAASSQVVTADKQTKEVEQPRPQAERKRGISERWGRHTKPAEPHNQRQRRKQVRQNPHLRKKWKMK